VATLSSSSNEDSTSNSSIQGSCVARATAALSLLGASGCSGTANGTVAVDRCLRLGGRCCVVSELPPPPKDQPAKLAHNVGVGSTGVVVEMKPWHGEAAVVFDHVSMGSSSDASSSSGGGGGPGTRIVHGVPLYCLTPAGAPAAHEDDHDGPRASSSSSHTNNAVESSVSAGNSSSSTSSWEGDNSSTGNIGTDEGVEVDTAASLATLTGASGGSELGTNAAIGAELMRKAPSALDALASAVMMLSPGAHRISANQRHETSKDSGSDSSHQENAHDAALEDAAEGEISPAELLISALAADALAVLATAVSSPSLTATTSPAGTLSTEGDIVPARDAAVISATSAAASLPLSALPLSALARAAAQPCVPDGLANGSAKSRACVAIELSQRLYEATTTTVAPQHDLGVDGDDNEVDEVHESKSSDQPPPLQRSHTAPTAKEGLESAQSSQIVRRSLRNRRRAAKASRATLWVGQSSYVAAVAEESVNGSNSAANNSSSSSSSSSVSSNRSALLPEGHASAVGLWACGPLFSAKTTALATSDKSESESIPSWSDLKEALGQPGLNLRFDPSKVSGCGCTSSSGTQITFRSSLFFHNPCKIVRVVCFKHC